MAQTPSIDRAWIAAELAKGVEAERVLAADAKARAESPPDPALSVLYHEIAAADERHAVAVETIAARYGHNPSKSSAGGIGQALGHIKDKIAGIGTTPLDQMVQDMIEKDRSIHWQAAWVHTLTALGDGDSARELTTVLTEEQAHRDALQAGFNRSLEQKAKGTAAG